MTFYFLHEKPNFIVVMPGYDDFFRSGSRGRAQGCAPPLPEMTCSFPIQLVFWQEKSSVAPFLSGASPGPLLRRILYLPLLFTEGQLSWRNHSRFRTHRTNHPHLWAFDLLDQRHVSSALGCHGNESLVALSPVSLGNLLFISIYKNKRKSRKTFFTKSIKFLEDKIFFSLVIVES